MADPESSLTSLLTTTLEERGILGKVRAELRANVFLAIHEQHGLAGPKGPPAALTSLQADSAGRLATHLVLELMQACGLDYSLSVFGPEANVKGMLAERGQLAEALGLKGGVKADEPLLVQFVRAALPGGGGVSPPPATAEAAIAQQAAIGGGGVSKQVSSSVSMEPAVNTTSISSAAPLAAQPVSKTTSDGGASKPQDKPDNSNTASAPLRAAGPPSPPSPASPLHSLLPPMGKPKGVPGGGAGFLSDLPPLSGRGATCPPLGGSGGGGSQGTPPGGSSTAFAPATNSAAGGGGGGGGGGEVGSEEKRLDALESKLSSLAGIPPVRAVGRGNPLPAVGGGGTGLSPMAVVGGASNTATQAANMPSSPQYDEAEIVEDDIMEEDFEDEDLGDESLSLDGSSGGATRLPSGLSPTSHPFSSARGRQQRLSPLDGNNSGGSGRGGGSLESSQQSLDESMSPSTLSNLRSGFDVAESIELPR